MLKPVHCSHKLRSVQDVIHQKVSLSIEHMVLCNIIFHTAQAKVAYTLLVKGLIHFLKYQGYLVGRKKKGVARVGRCIHTIYGCRWEKKYMWKIKKSQHQKWWLVPDGCCYVHWGSRIQVFKIRGRQSLLHLQVRMPFFIFLFSFFFQSKTLIL